MLIFRGFSAKQSCARPSFGAISLSMRLFIVSLLLLAGANFALADIQDPPSNRYDKTRKLSRGIANIAYGSTEIPFTIAKTNNLEGNSAAASLGIISGVRRTIERVGVGIFEVVTHPFPVYRGGYKPAFFKSPVRGHRDTYEEFPPELGFRSVYSYTRND